MVPRYQLQGGMAPSAEAASESPELLETRVPCPPGRCWCAGGQVGTGDPWPTNTKQLGWEPILSHEGSISHLANQLPQSKT